MSTPRQTPPQSSLLPAELAQHTVESLYASHGAQRVWTYWLLLFGAIGLLASLPLIKVDVSVRAAGLVRPTMERAEVRPAVSGHIAEVLGRDNERVRSGQPLLVIGSRDLEERLARNQALQAEHAALIHDLHILTTEPVVVTGNPSGDTTEKDVIAGPLFVPSLFYEGSVVKPLLRTAALRQEQTQFAAQWESRRLAQAKARHELARYTLLEARGIATRQELENASYEAERSQAESRLLIEQTLVRWQARLREEHLTQAALLSEAERLREEKAHYILRAPADGQLMGFNAWSAGGYVSAGQSLGVVSPETALQVETYVSPRDIGQIRVGQAARLQIDAYSYTQCGTLDGTVTSISGDLLRNGGPETNPSFKVLVQPAAAFIALPNGTRGDLKKGLTLSARFLVSRRSLLQLLYEDASSRLDPQGSPRSSS
jgi:multidrug resistance efflux pump